MAELVRLVPNEDASKRGALARKKREEELAQRELDIQQLNPQPSETQRAYLINTSIPRQYWKMYIRVTSGNHPSEATHLFCIQCQGWDRKAAVKCSFEGCIKWRYRPGTKAVDRRSNDRSSTLPGPVEEQISVEQAEEGVCG